ncbi:MAG TPA: biopolymer transporter ExbD [Verrucomicrobiae bacterium]|nr:biopolymer transporter ExbD [Verrucomicrobiae bacterium]
MRRFSQRSHLVTLSDINITPLLDLAFVLLIIFIITTPLLTQSIELKLPRGGQTNQHVDKNDIKTVEVAGSGIYKYEARQTPLPQIISALDTELKNNPNMVVYIRADKDCRYDLVAQLLDGCQKRGITRYSLRTDPTPK